MIALICGVVLALMALGASPTETVTARDLLIALGAILVVSAVSQMDERRR